MMSGPQSAPTILIVEDEPSIRTIERAGYELIVAKNGDEALALANDHTGAIDLLVTDVTMPGMNGFELGGYIGGIHPETSVLFVSGYAEDSSPVRKGLRTAGQAFLLKPFTRDALLGKVKEIFDS
jgi:YesN/AraC family two-component response regulator